MHSLDVMIGNAKSRYSFGIEEKQYREQRITIKNERQVNPLPVDMERINRERPIISKAKSTWPERDVVSLILDLLVIAFTSSPFGLKRFFNDQTSNLHSDLDLAANLGTSILAAAPGRVINVGKLLF